jgi:hypothetical protein
MAAIARSLVGVVPPVVVRSIPQELIDAQRGRLSNPHVAEPPLAVARVDPPVIEVVIAWLICEWCRALLGRCDVNRLLKRRNRESLVGGSAQNPTFPRSTNAPHDASLTGQKAPRPR